MKKIQISISDLYQPDPTGDVAFDDWFALIRPVTTVDYGLIRGIAWAAWQARGEAQREETGTIVPAPDRGPTPLGDILRRNMSPTESIRWFISRFIMLSK